MSSTIASITSWQPARPPRSLTSVSRSSASRRSSSLRCPFATRRVEPALDARAGARERRVVDIAADDLAAALEQHLRDARAHRAEADDAHACDRFHARER